MWYYQQVSLYMGIKGGKSTLKVKVHFQVIIFKLIDNTITKFKNVYSQSPLSFRKKVTINILHVKFTDVNLVLIFPLSHPLLNFLINHWSSNQSALCWRKRDVHFYFFKKLYRIYKFFFLKTCYTYACCFSKINKMFRSTNKFINYLLHPGQNIADELKNELFIFRGAGNKEQWNFQIKVVGPFCCGFENKSRRLSLI